MGGVVTRSYRFKTGFYSVKDKPTLAIKYDKCQFLTLI